MTGITEAARERLPNRRDSRIETIEWNGGEWTVGVSFGSPGRVREVFVDPAHGSSVRVGSDIVNDKRDACIVLSRSLQRGERPGELAQTLRALHDGTGEAKPTLMLLIVEAAARLEAADGPATGEAAAP